MMTDEIEREAPAYETPLRPGWMTAREAAARLNRDVQTVHILNQSGQLPGYVESDTPGKFIKKVSGGFQGRTTYYKEEDVNIIAAERRDKPAPEISQADREKAIELGNAQMHAQGYVHRIKLLEQINTSEYPGKSRKFFNNHYFAAFKAIADQQQWPQPPRGRYKAKGTNKENE